MKLDRNFYKRDTILVAKDLLGKILIHKINNKIVKGLIVEVEAYKGLEDKAAHSYHGKITSRVKVMYGDPGYAYVFIIYGMYNCMNVVTRESGIPEAVLIRGIEPITEFDYMSMNRYKKSYSSLTEKQKLNLTNGPGKLCIAMDINRSHNGVDLCGDKLYIEECKNELFEIEVSKRIGINYAEEAKDFLWRFSIKDNPYVSR